MKNKIKHAQQENINTSFVFSENSQVYLKKDTAIEDDWFPIDFQWIATQPHDYNSSTML